MTLSKSRGLRVPRLKSERLNMLDSFDNIWSITKGFPVVLFCFSSAFAPSWCLLKPLQQKKKRGSEVAYQPACLSRWWMLTRWMTSLTCPARLQSVLSLKDKTEGEEERSFQPCRLRTSARMLRVRESASWFVFVLHDSSVKGLGDSMVRCALAAI